MTTSQTFAIACPGCGVGLRVAVADLGGRRDCPECQTPFQLPSRQQAAAAMEARRQAKQQFGFACELCGSRLYARSGQIGHPMKCPDCHAVNHVPKPKVKKKAEVVLDKDSESYDLIDDEQWRSRESSAAEDQFGFPCRVCRTLIYATPALVGKHTACPDCSTVMIVPKPPPPKKKLEIKADDHAILVSPAAPRPEQETVNVEKLVGDAEARLAEKEREKPKPPKHPFFSGVFTFPFHPKSLPFALIFSFMAGLVATLFQVMLDLDGLLAILGIFVAAIAGMIGIVLVTMSCNYLVRVVNWTAMGYPNIGVSPDFEFLDFVRQALFVVNALGVSALPGVIAGIFTEDMVLGYLISMGCMYLFFPFVFLSFLDAESPTVPFSPFVYSTFRMVRGSWVKFYLLSLIPIGMIVGSHMAAAYFAPQMYTSSTLPPEQILSIVVTIVGLMIYFRLLGRLAYVIDRAAVKAARKEAAKEA